MDALSHAGAPKEPRSHAPSASSKPRAAEPAAQRERAIVATAEAAWSDPGLLGKTGAAASHCRAQRLPLSLFLAEIDRFDQWIFSHGQETAATMARKLEGVIGQQLDAGSSCLHLGDGQYAVLLPDSERTSSVATAKEIARRVREFGAPLGEATGTSLTLSIGLASLAVVPKNFPPQELIASARRCLDGAQLSGGDTLKSIELV
jgi:GGDEF domain-containing protein